MRLDYQHPDLGDDPQEDPWHSHDVALARKIGAFLLTNYAGHPFRAEVMGSQGVAKIYITELMGSVNGYILHIADLKNENDFNRLLDRACGEILERYRIPRAGFSGADYVAALQRAPLIGLDNAPVPE